MRLIESHIHRKLCLAMLCMCHQVIISPVGNTHSLHPAEPASLNLGIPAVNGIMRHLRALVLPEPQPCSIDTHAQQEPLRERHLISKEHAEADGARGVAIDDKETVSVMVNEEDHLRIQVLKSGFQLGETWEIIDELDDAIDHELTYAFSAELGYLTACPTNVGTGMRASVMLHLPGLLFTKQIDKVITAVGKMSLVVRGLYGEGTQYAGSLYQISNQVTLGKSEEEILDNIVSTVPQIVRYERRAREMLLSQNRPKLEDRVYRSLGMLKSARTISSSETITLLSHLRLGINLGLIEMAIGQVNQLFIRTLPAHLQKMEGEELGPDERDRARATFIRTSLGDVL